MRTNKRQLRRTGARLAADFALVLALFWLIAWATSTIHARAAAFHLPMLGAPAASLHADDTTRASHYAAIRTEQRAMDRAQRSAHRHSLILLSITIAALAALNLAFWRHLRRVYASPRRGVWRRD